ncbi:sigma 54-interacting transcriptional regulator [Sediminibacterium sp.]|uniref:sigma 54-interacting transcriptional regulator n=1 Tax=Sediminibacterium sp. TaxID=1917865 RepID=UPI003F700F93
MKTLITWLGYNEDFVEKGDNISINPSGFTCSVHKDIYEEYKYDNHIILYTSDREGEIKKQLERRKYELKDHLNTFFKKHKFELVDSNIDKSDLQSYTAIESSLRSLINSFDADNQLSVIAGTGPTAVAMAWSNLSISMQNRFSLYLLQKPEYTKSKKISSLIELKPVRNEWLDNVLRENHFKLELPDDIYKDSIVIEEYKKAEVVAKALDINVLILGETGCGKDRMAEFIVNNSGLDKTKYRAINCASLPDELLYSELFGHLKGSFTGAEKDRIGLFEECNRGVLFLDEIGDISPYMQQSLLRALENKEIKKMGSNEIKKDIQVRIISATNNNLYQKCKEGKFRFDLYYRLCSMEIELMPYRDRNTKERKDIISYYQKILEKKWGKKIEFDSDAILTLNSYSFPGNFREIYNTLNSLFVYDKNIIDKSLLPKRFSDEEIVLNESYENVMKSHCIKVYEKYNYNLTETKKALGYKNSTQLKEKLILWGVFKEH